MQLILTGIPIVIDWTKLTTDPNDSEAVNKVQNHLKEIRVVRREDYSDWLCREVADKTVLDIGAVEHNLEYARSPYWKHRKLIEYARKVVGVDILEEYAAVLNKEGFDIRVCDATSDEYIGEKFDVVVIGDVIEHVSDAIKLVEFSIRHLNDYGEVIIKTPNPYYTSYIKKYLREKPFVNLEHMSWITPTMMLEIARRANCKLKKYIVDPKKSPLLAKFINPEMLSRDYIYILGK